MGHSLKFQKVFFHTLKSFCGTGCMVLVRVKLKCQLLVRSLEIVFCTVVSYAEDFVVVFAPAYASHVTRHSD